MNRAIITGNLTRDVEVRKTNSNKSVCGFTVAVNDGQTTEFIECEAWESTADNMSKYTHKGSKVLVEGVIHVNEYEKDGNKVRRTIVRARNVEFLSPKNEEYTHKQSADEVYTPIAAKDESKIYIETEELPFY